MQLGALADGRDARRVDENGDPTEASRDLARPLARRSSDRSRHPVTARPLLADRVGDGLALRARSCQDADLASLGCEAEGDAAADAAPCPA